MNYLIQYSLNKVLKLNMDNIKKTGGIKAGQIIFFTKPNSINMDIHSIMYIHGYTQYNVYCICMVDDTR